MRLLLNSSLSPVKYHKTSKLIEIFLKISKIIQIPSKPPIDYNEAFKITKTPLKPSKWQDIHQYFQNNQNTIITSKMPLNFQNDQNPL